MVSLAMVVLEVLVNEDPQVALAEDDDSVEALFFDGPDETFRVGSRS